MHLLLSLLAGLSVLLSLSFYHLTLMGAPNLKQLKGGPPAIVGAPNPPIAQGPPYSHGGPQVVYRGPQPVQGPPACSGAPNFYRGPPFI